MTLPLAAVIAFVAFGALLSGAVLLLLLNPGSSGVRWWVAFQSAQIAWLGAQGWARATGVDHPSETIVSISVHLLPALFVAFALADLHGGLRRPERAAWLAVAAGVATIPLALLAEGSPALGWFIPIWHVALWSAGSWILVRWNRRARSRGAVDHRLGLLVIGLLVLVGPVALLGYLVFGPDMWLYVMPVLVIWIQFLVFIGVTRLRFYDIEVRLRRTGEIAADAAEQARLAVLGEVAASLAHEIRNPLTGVRSLAQRLAEEEIDPDSRARYARVILDEVGRVDGLVKRLLGLARKTPDRQDHSSRVDLDGLFEDLVILLGSRAARGGVALQAQGGGLEVMVPREPLSQILLNLLLNAVAHAPSGSAVTLEASPGPDGVVISVRDSGPGVPDHDRERIWEPFESGTGGTGLGLAVVRRLSRENGWEVIAGGAPGGGAEFQVRIPAGSADLAKKLEGAAR